MALNINTNIGALGAAASASAANRTMESAMERLASGLRINSAADDAAGVAISSRMEAQVRGINQAIRNAGDGQALANTAEGAMVEITNMLQRMRELAVQSASDTLGTADRENINDEVTQLKSEIDRIVSSTTYNSKVLLDGTASLSLQIGHEADHTMSVNIGNLSSSSLGTTSTSATASASTSVVANGTKAISNVVNLTFNGNDSYSFKIEFDGDAAKEITVPQTAMALNDASTIATAINAAIAGDADVKGLASATAAGSTVTLTALDGAAIEINTFASVGSGTMTVNPITNSAASATTLEDTTELTALVNTGGTAATASTASLQLQQGHGYSFKVNGTVVDVAAGDAFADTAAAIKSAIEGTSGGTVTVTGAAVANTHNTFDIADSSGAKVEITAFNKLSTAAVADGRMTLQNVKGTASSLIVTLDHDDYVSETGATGGGDLSVEDGTTSSVHFSNTQLSYSFEFNDVAYTVDGKTKDFMSELTTVAQAITDANTGVTAANVGGILEISNASGADVVFVTAGNVQLDAEGVAAVAEGTAYFLNDALPDNDISDNAGVQTLQDGSTMSSTDGTTAVASQMFLDFSADDRYTFTVDGDGAGVGAVTAVITADVTNGGLDGVVNTINAKSTTTGVTASVSNGQVVLDKADGTSFSVTGFSAEGTGKITAVNAGGQGGSAVLENAGAGATTTIAASGKAVATTLELSFSGADKFSFKISDGASTATVRATDVIMADAAGASATAVDHANEVADLKAEINRALTAANMDHITVSDSSGKLVLTNALGSKLEITDFTSDSTGTMTATPGSGQGVGKILNDDAVSGAQSAVSAIDITSNTGATAALASIDRALETVGHERANLGAISNRLDHTIANLTNVATEASVAQGRIQDADFAAESTNLAKSQILQQASMAMLAQANASKQGVLSLLQG
jgi:flagellin